MNSFCPCCGYKTLSSERHYDICSICFWEDDPIQYDDPFCEGGANQISLLTAKDNFERIGASDIESLQYVRKPIKYPDRDVNWRPYKEFLFDLCKSYLEYSGYDIDKFYPSEDIDEIARVKYFIEVIDTIDTQKVKEICFKIISSTERKYLWAIAYKHLSKYSGEDIDDLFIKFLIDYRGDWPEIEDVINEYFRSNK
jgi:hypothetical protein